MPDVPWVERPEITLDSSLSWKKRVQQIPVEIIQQGERLLNNMKMWIPKEAYRYVPVIRIRTLNRFQKEMVALGQYAQIDWQDILIANVSYDLMLASFGCSTVALATKTGPVLARNMDWWPEDLLARCSYLFRSERSGKLQFVQAGWPGSVGVVTGLSGNGFAFALNAVAAQEPFCPTGYPVLLHLRRVLEDALGFEQAVELIEKQRFPVGGLITLIGRENHQRVVIEREPTKAALRWGKKNEPLITTNDYRTMDVEKDHYYEWITNHPERTHNPEFELMTSTCTRYDAMCSFLSEHRDEKSISDEELLYYLCDDSVQQTITAQHIIMRPAEDSIRLLVPKALLSSG